MDYKRVAQTLTPISLAPGLYVIGTPIGNAADLTLRALETLLSCDQIFCEDTRVTAKLLALYGIEKPLQAYHDKNGPKIRPRILEALGAGKALALVSDAGLPLISDPGFPLLAAVREAGHPVEVLPGANAALTALPLSGLPTDRFYFGGFLPTKSAARKKVLQGLYRLDATLIFYEAPHRISVVLTDCVSIFDDRDGAVCRELTKKFEEIRRGSLQDLAAYYDENGAPKGELVLVIGPPQAPAAMERADVEAALLERLAATSLKEAVADVTALTGLPRRTVYDLALKLKGSTEDQA